LQVVLNKNQKHQLVIELHQQGKTMREIAQQVHMSFGDIGKIIRKIDGLDDNIDANDLSSKSKSTKALHLFKSGKKPIDVAIELDMSASEVEELQQEFWALNQLHEIGFLFNEIRNYLPSFIKLFNLLKRNKLLGDGYISRFLRYAIQDFPSLESKIQNLTGDVIELEWKKKLSQDIIEILNSSISQLKRSLNSYEMTIGLKKLILTDLDEKINQKLASAGFVTT
jgi:hypothetical protein